MTEPSMPDDPNPYYSPESSYGAREEVLPQEEVSQRTVEFLRQTRPWVLFLSVLTFIGCGLMILAGLAVLVAGASMGVGSGEQVAFIAYLLMGFLYVVPAIFLFRYGSRIGDLIRRPTHGHLEGALEAQKSFWRFAGILALVLIALYVVIIVVAVGFAVMQAAR